MLPQIFTVEFIFLPLRECISKCFQIFAFLQIVNIIFMKKIMNKNYEWLKTILKFLNILHIYTDTISIPLISALIKTC